MSLVVILDDRPTNRNIFSKLAASLESQVTVQAFGDPLDALDWLTDHTPDLVIADYRNTHFQNAAFAGLVKQANAEPDVAKRHALFLQANKILETEQPYSGLYNPTDLWLVKPNVAGLEHEGVLDEFHIGEASFK